MNLPYNLIFDRDVPLLAFSHLCLGAAGILRVKHVEFALIVGIALFQEPRLARCIPSLALLLLPIELIHELLDGVLLYLEVVLQLRLLLPDLVNFGPESSILLSEPLVLRGLLGGRSALSSSLRC